MNKMLVTTMKTPVSAKYVGLSDKSSKFGLGPVNYWLGPVNILSFSKLNLKEFLMFTRPISSKKSFRSSKKCCLFAETETRERDMMMLSWLLINSTNTNFGWAVCNFWLKS